MKADYVHKDSRTLEEKPQVFTRWIDPTIKELKQENKQLKDNWNKLKKQLEEELTEGRSIENQWLMGCYDQIKEILNKMQELERGSDSNE